MPKNAGRFPIDEKRGESTVIASYTKDNRQLHYLSQCAEGKHCHGPGCNVDYADARECYSNIQGRE